MRAGTARHFARGFPEPGGLALFDDARSLPGWIAFSGDSDRSAGPAEGARARTPFLAMYDRLTLSRKRAMVDVMRYPGGKNGCGTWQKIINLMPPHEVYIEPFLGSGAVLRRKRPARLNVGIDLDARMVAGVSAAIAQVGERVDNRQLVVFSSDRRSKDITLDNDGWRNFILIRPNVVATIDKSSDSGSLFRFVVGDAFNFLSRFHPKGGELLYLDPPYLPETVTRSAYTYDLTRLDHIRLLEICTRLKCKIVLSGYHSTLYMDALEGWTAVHFPAITRGGTLAEEYLWLNYTAPTSLHDYRFLGQTFRDRERLNRRIRRWTKRLERMDALERQALLCSIQSLGPASL
jgi:hypothetical protein